MQRIHHDAFHGTKVSWSAQKAPLRISEIWAIRVRLEIYERVQDLELFNLAIDSKLRGRDLVQLRVQDITHGGRVSTRFPTYA